ncbi:hypothetical protein MLD38_023528 [Melastoma candidum]|uniref:Uncharacterized protein n=1 Tax=Melastoma candidum TaxID=119954 RepID=A0ACB9NPR9_9MYRT|nr:hypothetical protein MLD38_023528 [Melastoma candidum]
MASNALLSLSPAASLRLLPYKTIRLISLVPTRRLSGDAASVAPRLRRWRRISGAAWMGIRGNGELGVGCGGVHRFGGNRVGEFRKRSRIPEIKGARVGSELTVVGWVRTVRVQSSVTFVEVNDGSCLSNMQCVIDADAEESGLVSTGASIWVQGTIVASQGSKQKIELKVNKIVLIGKSDPSFPIQKKRVSREFLRTKAHLRPRTNTFGALQLLVELDMSVTRLGLIFIPHAGFGLGFERLMQFSTGWSKLGNITANVFPSFIVSC